MKKMKESVRKNEKEVKEMSSCRIHDNFVLMLVFSLSTKYILYLRNTSRETKKKLDLRTLRHSENSLPEPSLLFGTPDVEGYPLCMHAGEGHPSKPRWSQIKTMVAEHVAGLHHRHVYFRCGAGSLGPISSEIKIEMTIIYYGGRAWRSLELGPISKAEQVVKAYILFTSMFYSVCPSYVKNDCWWQGE